MLIDPINIQHSAIKNASLTPLALAPPGPHPARLPRAMDSPASARHLAFDLSPSGYRAPRLFAPHAARRDRARREPLARSHPAGGAPRQILAHPLAAAGVGQWPG